MRQKSKFNMQGLEIGTIHKAEGKDLSEVATGYLPGLEILEGSFIAVPWQCLKLNKRGVK